MDAYQIADVVVFLRIQLVKSETTARAISGRGNNNHRADTDQPCGVG
jgi:hypothetical protein